MSVSQLVLHVFGLWTDVTMKATVLLLGGCLAAWLLSSSSAAIRHRAWSLTLIGLLLLPALSRWLPAWQLAVFPAPMDQPLAVISQEPPQPHQLDTKISVEESPPEFVLSDEPAVSSAVPAATKPIDLSSPASTPAVSTGEPVAWMPWLVVSLWLFGMMISFSYLAGGLWRVRQLSRNSQRVGDPGWNALITTLRSRLGLLRAVELRESSEPTIPLTWGMLRPKILIPPQAASWTDSMRRAVLLHELAHVQRADVLYQLLGRAACALFWFHPLAWLALKQLQTEREQACDDAVLHTGEQASSYAEQLLEVARLYCRPQGLTLAVEMARTSQLEQRLRAMFDAARSHAPLNRRTAVGALIFSLCLIIALAVIKPVTQSFQAIAEELPPPKMLADQPWGEVSHGLQCRLLAASSATFDEDPGSAVQTERFSDADDVTFAVELRNVSPEAISLLNATREIGNADVPVVLTNHSFAPLLFDLEIQDELGQPIDRPSRLSEGRDVFFLAGVPLQKLQTGQSAKVLLRPSRFLAPFDYQLSAGSYRAKVRYHGPSPAALDEFRNRRFDPRSHAWPHEVWSNEVSFSVEKSESRPVPQLVWGPVNDGLQAALEFRYKPPKNLDHELPDAFPVGANVRTVYHVRNVSDRTIQFVSDMTRPYDVVNVNDGAGRAVRLPRRPGGVTQAIRWTLKPGQVAELPFYGMQFSKLEQPGRYLVSCRLNFGQVDGIAGKRILRPDDWKGEVDIGETPINVRVRTPQDNFLADFPLPLLSKAASSTVQIQTVSEGVNSSTPTRHGQGFAFVIDERGYAVTLFHLVNGVDSIRVQQLDGARFNTAELVAADPDANLAIIRFERMLPAAPLGTSANLKVGDPIYPVSSQVGTTRSVITVLSREVKLNEDQWFKNLIQYDAERIDGSGIPLLNAEGKVIGMNLAIRAGKTSIGFAIPIDDIRPVVARLMQQIEP